MSQAAPIIPPRLAGPLRRVMSSRQRSRVFTEFSKWGFDRKGWAPRTREKYYQRALACEFWLLQNRGRSITAAAPKDFQAFLFSTPPTARNRNNIRQALIAFCDFLTDVGYTETNNASGLPRLPEPRHLPKSLTSQQASAVLDASHIFTAEKQALIHVLVYAGLRKSEARLLERSHVVGWEYLQFMGKGSRERVVPIHPELRVSLRRWLASNPDPRWVFPSPRRLGEPISETCFKLWVREIGEAAGIDGLHPHQLRHTLATLLVENGTAPDVVQHTLGHADLRTTQIYLRTRPERVKDAVLALDVRRMGREPVEPASPSRSSRPVSLMLEREEAQGL